MKIVKYFVLFLVIVFYSASVYSADTSTWGENSSVFNEGFDNQKAISDSTLKKAVDMLKDRQLTFKQRRQKREVKPNAPMYDVDYLKNFTDSTSPDDELNNSLTVMIPTKSYSDDGKIVSPGYYKLSCRKISTNEYVLDLSQGTTVILTVPAVQTNEDLKQEAVTFCNAEVIDNGRIRLMYGNIDLNLVGYIYFK